MVQADLQSLKDDNTKNTENEPREQKIEQQMNTTLESDDPVLDVPDIVCAAPLAPREVSSSSSSPEPKQPKREQQSEQGDQQSEQQPEVDDNHAGSTSTLPHFILKARELQKQQPNQSEQQNEPENNISSSKDEPENEPLDEQKTERQPESVDGSIENITDGGSKTPVLSKVGKKTPPGTLRKLSKDR